MATYSSLITTRPDLINSGSLTPSFTDSQPQQNRRWKLGRVDKLKIICCWMFFRLIMTLLLTLIAFNHEIGLVTHIQSIQHIQWIFWAVRWTPTFVKYFLTVLWWTWIFRLNSRRYNFALRTEHIFGLEIFLSSHFLASQTFYLYDK
jgi:hypothetical protein